MDELLIEIKTRLGITGEYNDALLKAYAYDVMTYLQNAGVNKDVINSSKSYGAISKGVADMWLDKQFSDIFKQMVIQLSLGGGTDE